MWKKRCQGDLLLKSPAGSLVITKVLSRSLVSKAVSNLDQSCPLSGSFNRTLIGGSGASHPVIFASSPSVSCVLFLVTRFLPGSWEGDIMLCPVSKLRPTCNPQLQIYSDKTKKAWCCHSHPFPKWGFFPSLPLSTQLGLKWFAFRSLSVVSQNLPSALIFSPLLCSLHLGGQRLIFLVF